MKLDKELKLRLSDAQLEKAQSDSKATDKTVSKHIRDMIVDFEVVTPPKPTNNFDCFEFHVVQARMHGCKTQCKECKQEQKRQEHGTIN